MSARQPFTRQDSVRGAEPESEKRENESFDDTKDDAHAQAYAQDFADAKNIPLADIQAVAEDLTIEEARAIVSLISVPRAQ